MMELLFFPVPAWMLLFVLGVLLMVIRLQSRSHERTAHIAETAILKQIRDDVFGKSP